ncbi:MAG TPA: hypothetical protein VN368_01325 [Candidatus Methylomirabilis sp.]|nr:hypothetical protein [Candidatus Methylomirabilis sp.]
MKLLDTIVIIDIDRGGSEVLNKVMKQRAFVTEKYRLPRGRCGSADEAGHSVLDFLSLPWGFSEKGMESAG